VSRFLLDANACIGILRGGEKNAKLAARFVQTPRVEIALCAIVKAELIFGAMRSADPAKHLAQVTAFVQPFDSFPFDDACVDAYGTLRADLTRAGTPIGPNDMLIASIALTHGLTVVTHNTKEFSRIAGLALDDWQS
jgi:tRNA(fMet)-specific endonuclease VapC